MSELVQKKQKELAQMFEDEHFDCQPWAKGKIPQHFKRLNVPWGEALRLAKKGFTEMAMAYNIQLFFCQSLIAGAILDDKYDEIVIASPSQYGKSFLMGHIALYRAYCGAKQYVTASVANLTQMIMGQTIAAVQEAATEIKNALMEKPTDIDRLASSISKQKLAFKNGGFVESITLGDTYQNNLSANKALGRAGDYIVDEAALVSDQSFIEMGRREFAKIDGTKYKSVLISNPHMPGIFYDKLTDPNPPESTFILWIDALTAVEETRFSKETVFNSEFAKNKSTLRRYLLCVLDVDGGGMFDVPKVHDEPFETEYTQYFLGVDSAYKGKDNICVALVAADNKGIRVEEVQVQDKTHWIEGVTSQDIISDIARISRKFHVANVCVDTGNGIWLNEGLIKKDVNSHGVNFAESPTKERVKNRHYCAVNALNKRAEMHLDLQDLIENNAISFSRQAYESVKSTLPYVTSERKTNGKIKIVDKEVIKAIINKSPDELDAVILAIHACITFLGDSVEPIV